MNHHQWGPNMAKAIEKVAEGADWRARRQHGRTMRYTVHSYATDRPETERGTR